MVRPLRRPRSTDLRWVSALILVVPALVGCQLDPAGGPPPPEANQDENSADGKSQGDRGRKKPSRPKPPRSRESLADGLRDFEDAVEAGDCPRIRSLAFYGDAQLNAEDCRKTFLPSLKGFRSESLEQHRTAGVVDFQTKRTSEAMAFLLDNDGRFRWALRVVRPQRRSTFKAPSRRRLDGVAASAVKAFRSGRCKPLAAAGAGVLFEPALPRRQCQQGRWLRGPLRRDPSVRPQRLGASSVFAFYALRPRGGPFTTLVLQVKSQRAAFSSLFAVPREG